MADGFEKLPTESDENLGHDVVLLKGTEDGVYTDVGTDLNTAWSNLYGNRSITVRAVPMLKPETWAMVLPASTKTIGEEAFAGITAETVQIPDGCTSIGEGAFTGSTLKAIEIPASVTTIGNNAFPTGTVIFTPDGSEAATWAENNGFKVVTE